MDYSEINTMIKRLVEQLQNITPQLELARGKEAWVMQETQDSKIVEEKIEEVFVAVYKNIEMSMKIAVQLQDICPHPLIKETIDQLHNLNYSPLPVCWQDLETKKASLCKGYVEDYIDNTKDTLVAINRLSQELSEVSLSLFISQRLRNIIGEIGVLRGQFAAYEYSGIDFPNPYDIIKRKIARLLNDIKSAQEICIQVSKNAAATLIKLYHSFSDVKGLVNRNFSKGETPPQKLNSIQDDLSQFFKKIEMKYQDLLEELAVEFELDHINPAEPEQEGKPVLTEKTLGIFVEVAKEYRKSACTLKQADLEATGKWSRKTIGKHFSILRRMGFLCRPQGEGKGDAPTQKGLDYLISIGKLPQNNVPA